MLGGSSLAGKNGYKGYFIEPTIITNMSTSALTTREEAFAPIVPLYKFKTEEEVISLANDSDVGLGCTSFLSFFLRSRDRRREVSLTVEGGQCISY